MKEEGKSGDVVQWVQRRQSIEQKVDKKVDIEASFSGAIKWLSCIVSNTAVEPENLNEGWEGGGFSVFYVFFFFFRKVIQIKILILKVKMMIVGSLILEKREQWRMEKVVLSRGYMLFRLTPARTVMAAACPMRSSLRLGWRIYVQPPPTALSQETKNPTFRQKQSEMWNTDLCQ